MATPNNSAINRRAQRQKSRQELESRVQKLNQATQSALSVATNPYRQQQRQVEETLTREAGAGRVPSGSRLKLVLQGQRQLGEQEAQTAKQLESNRLLQELQLREAERGREFASDEQQAQRTFTAQEQEKQRQFARGERIGQQEFARSERIGQEAFQAEQLGKQLKQQADALKLERNKAFGIYKTDAQGNVIMDANGNPQVTQLGALELERQKLEMDKAAQGYNQFLSLWEQIDPWQDRIAVGQQFAALYNSPNVDDATKQRISLYLNELVDPLTGKILVNEEMFRLFGGPAGEEIRRMSQQTGGSAAGTFLTEEAANRYRRDRGSRTSIGTGINLEDRGFRF